MPDALAVVQARMSSSRLPGKVLADVGGEPMLALQLRRLSRSRRIERLVVATSDRPDDEPVVRLAASLGTETFRGSLEDVLGRFAGAVADHAGPVLRLTADCPLHDPAVCDAVVELLQDSGADYASNVDPRGFPHGLDCEAITAEALLALHRDVTDPRLREHVTLALRETPERHRIAHLDGDPELGELRWTVDTPEDLDFVREVVPRLGDRRHDAPWAEVLDAVRAAPSLADHLGRRG